MTGSLLDKLGWVCCKGETRKWSLTLSHGWGSEPDRLDQTGRSRFELIVMKNGVKDIIFRTDVSFAVELMEREAEHYIRRVQEENSEVKYSIKKLYEHS